MPITVRDTLEVKMPQSPSAAFTLGPDFNVHDLPSQIGTGYSILETESEQRDEEYLDTFDWRLLASGRALARSQRRYRLYSTNGDIICQDRGPAKLRPFCWDFSDGPLRDELKAAADIRALCPQVQMQQQRQHYNLLNADEKIVLRLRRDTMTAVFPGKEPEQFSSLHLYGIRGYSRPLQTVSRIIGQSGGLPVAEGEIFLVPALKAAGISPEKMRAKFAVSLQPDITVFEGLKDVGQALLADISMHQPGVIEDIDSEYLHDFRIALRRTRSLLSLYSRILPISACDYFRNEFKWITQTTNTVRDCDVYLLMTEEYQAMLPARLHPGLISYFEGLRTFRKKEFKLMRRRLKSQRAARLFSDWPAFLQDELQLLQEPKGKTSCRLFAAKMLKKRYKRILAKGSECGPESPDTMLHALRIQAKKLRYLLEFFRSLFSVDDVDQLIKHLKKLQNNLGEFNDLSVQQTMLGSFQSPVKTDSVERMLRVAAALGGLITHLADRQALVRGEFGENFLQFAGKDVQGLVKTIIGDSEHVSREDEGPPAA